MKIIEPNVELLEEKNIYKKIERAGRICYKSEDKITDTSYKNFIKMIVNRGHLSVLEHATITAEIDLWDTIAHMVPLNLMNQFVVNGFHNRPQVVTANARAWREMMEIFPINDMLDLHPILFDGIKRNSGGSNQLVSVVKNSDNFFIGVNAEDPNSIRETFIVTTSRDISHQIVRHRSLSVSQESQRYCNYTKDKFSGVKFIMPKYIKNNEFLKEYWLLQRDLDEKEYNLYIDSGAKPEEARNCLPNATATSLVLTSSLEGWMNFTNLRAASDAQGEIAEIAREIRRVILNKYKHNPYLKIIVDTKK